MPTVHKRKTTRGLVSSEIMDLAAEEVLLRKIPYREAANSYQVCYVTLYRYVRKKKRLLEKGSTSLPIVGYVSKKRIFSDSEEKILAQYLLHCSQINYGLTTKEVRKLAFQLAVKYNKEIPSSLSSNEPAGADWLRLFMCRNPRLSIRAPQATSIARSTSFNRSNVELFFRNYTEILERENYAASAIWNMDETGITTVQNPNRVIAGRGTKQVSSVTSAERGVLVTVATAVNVIGNSIPPMFIFPRKRFKDHFIRDAPYGLAGSANGSGWMQEDDFNIFLNHFKTRARPYEKNKCILLLDNHSSHTHIALKNIDFCKDNGIVLLTFPPHCTLKMQPLDRSVFGPLKKAVNNCCDNWMRSNPGKVMTIYDIPSIVRESFPIAVTPRNIQAGFACTGIWPVNTQVFTDEHFLPSSVTDRPLEDNTILSGITHPIPSTSHHEPESMLFSPSPSVTPPLVTPPVEASMANSAPSLIQRKPSFSETDVALFSIRSDNSNNPSTSATLQNVTNTSFSPYEVKPLPRAAPRTKNRRRKVKRKSAIMTDTPNKLEIQEQEERRKRSNGVKKQILQNTKENTLPKSSFTDQTIRKTKTRKKKQIAKDSDTLENEDCFCLVCVESFASFRRKNGSSV